MATQLTLKFKQFNDLILFLSVAMLSVAILLLAGCKTDLESIIKGVNANSENEYCNAKSEPFFLVQCDVSQNELTSNKNLSLRLFWKSGKLNTNQNAPVVDTDKTLKPLYTFDALLNDLPNSDNLLFATNAGMYDSDFAPIGYTVIQGEQILSLNLKNGRGNFHLNPNGVLWWDKHNKVNITESHHFGKLLKNESIKPWYATQSGPLLVINNKIHPKFIKTSSSLKIRNGVGVCDDETIKFVTAKEPVNFYQFASYFKNSLGCPNALFLDGGVATSIFAPEINLKDKKNMGVMLGLIENQSPK